MQHLIFTQTYYNFTQIFPIYPNLSKFYPNLSKKFLGDAVASPAFPAPTPLASYSTKTEFCQHQLE